jgi:hypothetical protein
VSDPFFVQSPALVRAIQLARAPRSVAPSAIIGTTFGRGVLISWTIVCFCSLYFWGIGADSEFITRLEFRGPTATTYGVVTETWQTSSRADKRRIWGAEYTYTAGGEARRGKSYGYAVPAVRSTVDVEYLRARPQISRIMGMRRRTHGAGAGFTLLLLPAALVTALGLTVRGARRAGLLKHGQLGFAKLVEKKPTGATVNYQRVHVYVFELDLPEEVPAVYRQGWQSAARKHRFTFKTHLGARLEDDPVEPVLYDPKRPGSGIPIDALPILITPSGAIAGTGSVALRLAAPAVAVVGNLVAATLTFM